MKNKFWVVAYDGNNWLAYSSHDSFKEASDMLDALKKNSTLLIKARISLVLDEVEF